MQKFPIVTLHRNKTEAIERFHPWIFSGAIKKVEGELKEGDVVEVQNESGKFLGIGHYATGSIAVRVFSFEPVESLDILWRSKFQHAYALRKQLGLTESNSTNAYRLINAEGDGMPGLVADFYNGALVLQAHNPGMHSNFKVFAEVAKEIFGEQLKAVFDKSSATLHSNTSAAELQNENGFLHGSIETVEVKENDLAFKIDFVRGQKTGFFLDQRDNRSLLSHYSSGKKILNTFSYSGGFSIYGLKAGAALVHSVDSSVKAIDLTNENVQLNFGTCPQHTSFTSDVFDFMKTAQEDYDIIILDPPAFAKSFSARHRAIQAYARLNATAFKKIKSGGMVFTFSCSQVVTPDLFNGAITAAAIEAGRKIQILHRLTQPADHPVSVFNPEGNYLKGLVLRVE